VHRLARLGSSAVSEVENLVRCIAFGFSLNSLLRPQHALGAGKFGVVGRAFLAGLVSVVLAHWLKVPMPFPSSVSFWA